MEAILYPIFLHFVNFQISLNAFLEEQSVLSSVAARLIVSVSSPLSWARTQGQCHPGAGIVKIGMLLTLIVLTLQTVISLPISSTRHKNINM